MRTVTSAARGVCAATACLIVAAGWGCAEKARPNLRLQPPAPITQFVASEVVAEVKDFAVTLGGQATGNFVRSSDRRIADTRCYFTGKLQLPEHAPHGPGGGGAVRRASG
jgi:hypothetical protein